MQSVKAICAVEYTAVKGGKKIMTNREWLESLPDSEMAKIIAKSCATCVYEDTYCGGTIERTCCNGTTEWLQQEHKDND